ncbi:ribose-5-phosphate isomerase RpiA [Pedobacter sandarakinus]|uniref:ribose-5-phosphate isomerase RpiA n=1 Tax=Pedobacter sandarakinus TaxID=353156 RepID=UPI0022463228|nr:ribose-5-phosphate isomerase RpiA [Pedobacter sandarakinus]MCX2573058.1 ribose-5-phosphate isomerase RpiA [Pedobacter sandarakinus]
MDKSQQDADKLAAAKAAVKFVKDGDIVGLGTGSTATYAIKELGKLVSEGLSIKAVGSSIRTEGLAKSLGIELLNLGEVAHIDVSIDGADEFTESLNLIKGGGGALFREKILASLSKNRIIVTDASKRVSQLGAFTLPVEVIPAAFQYVIGQITSLNAKPVQRFEQQLAYVTDNGNYIVDVDFGFIENPKTLSNQLNNIDGLLAHGLFVGLTDKIIMSNQNNLTIFE